MQVLILCRRFDACRDCIASGRSTCGFFREGAEILLPRRVDYLVEMDIVDTDPIIANASRLGSQWLTHLTRTRYESNQERSRYNYTADGRDFLTASCNRHDRQNLVHIGPYTLAGKCLIKGSLLALAHTSA
jgi:hypothetical protein